MAAFILRRLAQAAITLIIVSVVTFVLIALSPGGFVIESSAGMSAEDLARIRSNLGLDLPLHVGRHPARVAAMGADIGFLAQEAGRRVFRRDQFVRVFVAQFLQREPAQGGDAHGLFQRRRRIDVGQAQA